MQPGTVVEYHGADSERKTHDKASHSWVTERLALLKHYDYGGVYDAGARYASPVYFVPDATLSAEAAGELGIRTLDDLYGGVAPYPFVATKAITHPLINTDAEAPHGWSHDFLLHVQDAVLFGYTAYSIADARLATERVLTRGPARFKAVRGIGGAGQHLVEHPADVEPMLEKLGDELTCYGVVIEQHLVEVETYSVGRVRVADLEASYWGTQRVTANRHGETAYGGSDLHVVRGDYEALLETELPPPARQAVLQARIYEAAAFESFPGLLASRCNYDIARGRSTDGSWRSGVLEQSWRIGGASPAEVAALERLRADTKLRAVRASTFEVYGACTPPQGALVQFQGEDERAGPITKYTLVEPDGRTARDAADHGR
jgi:hypothetical protein